MWNAQEAWALSDSSAHGPQTPGSLRLARVVIGLSQRVGRVLPGSIRQRLENRVFFSVFQVTRVTNDAYGWKPGEKE